MTSIPVRTVQDTYIQEAELYLQASGTFALPFAVDPMVKYWKKIYSQAQELQILQILGAEFPLLVGELTKSDSNANIKQSLASLGEYRNINNAKELISTLIMQAGSSIVEGDAYGNYKSTLYSSVSGQSMVPAVSAMNFYTEYANPKKTVYSWNRSLPSSKQFFLAENLALYFGFASEYNDIKQKNPNLNFDVAMMPQTVDAKNKVTFGRMYGFSLMKSSPNIVQAYQMISLLTGKQAATVFAKVSDFAPVRRDLISEGTKDSVKTIFYSSALISKAWLDPDMVKTDSIFKNMVENITTGRSDAGGAVQDASGEIDNLL
jgi:ABC-type glycerol-3-phosphate transport system substrate-binding protein